MSLINQMINQLDQRGAEGNAELAMVRPVSRPAKPRSMVFFVALPLAVAALLIALAWQWKQKNDHLVAQQKPLPISQHVVAAPVSSVTEASAVAEAAPVFQLSFELGTVALPELPVEPEKPIAANARPRSVPAPAAKKPALTTPDPSLPDDRVLPVKQISSKQQAESEFRKAVLLMQQGRIGDALAGYEAALNLDAGHDQARQALVLLLLENKRGADAERVLQEALKNKPEKISFAMMMARLQVERGAIGDGVLTLEKSLPFAGQQADYQAFLAALLQRQDRHKEASIITKLLCSRCRITGFG